MSLQVKSQKEARSEAYGSGVAKLSKSNYPVQTLRPLFIPYFFTIIG